jgi:hypothetical protein
MSRAIINWVQYDHMLGEISDRKLANIIGCAFHTVAYRRKKLQIDNYRKKMGLSKTLDWQFFDNLMGTMTDKNLSNLIGCSESGVAHRRKKLGIKSFSTKNNIGFTKINWNNYDHLLGKLFDKKISNIIGCSKNTVRIRRNKLNIKPYKNNNHNINAEEYKHLLGTMEDKHLAQALNCSTKTIINARLELNIKSFKISMKNKLRQELLEKNLVHCKICNQTKNKNDFPVRINKTIISYGCKCIDCRKTIKKDQRTIRKQELINILGGCCQNCGFNAHQSALQFHHVNGNKEKMISSFYNSPTKYHGEREKLFIELDKCCLLCSNCHDAFHGSDIMLKFQKKMFGWEIIV